jgi:hypothetical protein
MQKKKDQKRRFSWEGGNDEKKKVETTCDVRGATSVVLHARKGCSQAARPPSLSIYVSLLMIRLLLYNCHQPAPTLFEATQSLSRADSLSRRRHIGDKGSSAPRLPPALLKEGELATLTEE